MECLVWLINKLNEYNGLFLVMLTIIGFWFVNKQIKIAKNKDILIILNQEMNILFDHYNDIYKKYFREIREELSYRSNITSITQLNHILKSKKYDDSSFENDVDYFKKTIKRKYPNQCIDLNASIEKFNWWIKIISDNKFLFDDEKEKKIVELNNNLIDQISASYLNEIYKEKKITAEKQISSLIEEMEKNHQDYINNEKNRFYNFLITLSKDAL